MQHGNETDMVSPVIVHVPHAATKIPEDVRHTFLLTEDALKRELLRMTDRYTDELFDFGADVATTIAYPISRLIVDPERFEADADEPMAERGMGVIYTRTSDLTTLREPPDAAERLRLIEAHYHPHHRLLTEAVVRSLEQHGSCLIIDAHSFSSVPLPYEPDQLPHRPDICIGTDPYHTPPWLATVAIDAFASQGMSVECNRPFGGALVPLRFYKTNAAVTSVMIEINRGLYMDESNGERSSRFEDVRAIIRAAVSRIISEAGRQT